MANSNEALPPASEPLPSPQKALAQIRALRYRRRRVRFFDGLLRLAASGVVVVWATFLLDWSLDLPVGVRMLQAAAGITLFVMALRIFVLSARRPVTDAWLAAQIEANGELEQALITAVQLGSTDNPRTQLYSPVLLARTIREAEEKIAAVNAASLVSGRGLGASAFVLLAALLPAVALGLWRSELADTYVQRDLLFRDQPWPRSYVLEVEEPASTETLIAMGDPLTVMVWKERGGHARVQLAAEFSDGSNETFTLEKKGEDRYRKVFRNTTRDFSFRITCGDWRSGTFRVRVRNRPRIEMISLRFDYPDYTGLDEAQAELGSQRNLGGHVKVPVDTVVTYTATISIPVSSATWIEEFQAGGEKQSREEALTVESGSRIAGTFNAARNGVYYFRLVSEDGFENPTPIRYRIAVIPDQPPTIQIVEPRRNMEVSSRAQISFAIQAHDDYGLASSRLIFQRGSDGFAETDVTETPEVLRTIELAAMGVTENGEAPREARSELMVDLEPMAIAEGSRLAYLAESIDAAQQRGLSRTYLLTVVAEDELTRILQDELTLVRESLEQTHEYQRESRSEVEGVVEIATSSGSRILESDLPVLRHSRLTQERISLRLEETSVRMEELIRRVLSNRLVWKEMPRVELIRDSLKVASEQLAPPALSAVERLVRLGGAREATRDHALDALDRQRRLERALGEILIELREWGDLNSVVKKLQDALERQRELEERVRAKVQEEFGN